MAQVKVKTLLGEYPHLGGLKSGAVKSDIVSFDFYQFKEGEVPHDFFKQTVKGEFDFSELALVTVLQAISFGHPIVALPVVANARYQHGQVAVKADSNLKPSEIKTIAERTHSQTTPTWARGVLQNEYGLDLSKVNFIAQIPGHVPEYQEPANVRRPEKSKKLADMVADGDVDAAIFNPASDPRLKSVVPNPDEVGKAWGKKNGLSMVNHILVVKSSFSKEHPEAVREIYRIAKESRKAANLPAAKDGIETRPIGYSQCKPYFEIALKYASQQGLLGKPISVDDLFDATTRALD